ncbi:XRE family transcriptional regulator [Amycolatopsis sp. cg5]|uniref:XRE family transcriptional regulator n=1 Tax=Amycolatopsis sp. cg5 TaxID=3238802 RepID=UPI0035237845
MADGKRGIAEVLESLIGAHAKLAGKKDLSSQEIAEAIRAKGANISHTTIWKLRTGQETNPRIETLGVLATHFGVQVQYFFDSDYADQVDRQLRVLDSMRAGKLLNTAARLEELSPEGQDSILRMIDRTLQRERENQPPHD